MQSDLWHTSNVTRTRRRCIGVWSGRQGETAPYICWYWNFVQETTKIRKRRGKMHELPEWFIKCGKIVPPLEVYGASMRNHPHIVKFIRNTYMEKLCVRILYISFEALRAGIYTRGRGRRASLLLCLSAAICRPYQALLRLLNIYYPRDCSAPLLLPKSGCLVYIGIFISIGWIAWQPTLWSFTAGRKSLRNQPIYAGQLHQGTWYQWEMTILAKRV